jgi:hypothetical protein
MNTTWRQQQAASPANDPQRFRLLNHSVRSQLQGLRDRQAERLCSLEVDNELDLVRQLRASASGFAPLKILPT